MKKQNLKLICILFILFSILSFVCAEENKEVAFIDIGKIMQLPNDVEITGNGVDYSSETKEEFGRKETINRITFQEDNAKLKIEGDEFTNIKKGKDSFIDLDKDGSIKKAELTTNEKGGEYFFGNQKISVPPNSKVIFNKDAGIKIEAAEGGEIKEFPSLDDPENLGYPLMISGSNIKLPDGITLTGNLNYDKYGQAYIPEEKITEINGIEISKSSRRTNVFFDGEEHKSVVYGGISFGKDNLFIDSSTKNPVTVNFKEGNPYAKIEEGDNFAVKSMPDSSIEIQNRDSQGLIPKVTTKGNFVMDEDGFSFEGKNNNVYMSFFGKINTDTNLIATTTTSPIELINLDKNRNQLFGDYKESVTETMKNSPQYKNSPEFREIVNEKLSVEQEISGNKLIIDNANRFAIAPSNKKEISAKTEDTFNTKFSSNLRYNYPTKTLIEKSIWGNKESGNIEFRGVDGGMQSKDLMLLRDYYNTLIPEAKESLKNLDNINIKDDSSFEKEYPESNSKNICAYYYSNKLNFKDSNFNNYIFRHETTHAQQYDKEAERIDKLSKLYDQRIILTKNLENMNEMEKINNKIKSLKKEEWNEINSWAEISGDIYQKNTFGKWSGTTAIVKDGISRWVDSKEGNELRNGCIRIYGCTDPLEDMATFVEKVSVDSKIFKNLIDPSSPNYDVRYPIKLGFLVRNKYISYDEYKKVFDIAGLKTPLWRSDIE